MSQPYHQHCQRALTVPNFSCLRRYRTAARRDLSKAILPLQPAMSCGGRVIPKLRRGCPSWSSESWGYLHMVWMPLRALDLSNRESFTSLKPTKISQRDKGNPWTGRPAKQWPPQGSWLWVKFRWYIYIPCFFIGACSFQLLAARKPYLSCLILLYKAKVKELRS